MPVDTSPPEQLVTPSPPSPTEDPAPPALDPHLATRVLDSLGEAVIATDPEGHIIFWNAAATELYGWEAEEVMGSNIVAVTPAPAMEERAGEIMSALRAGDSWTGEFLIQVRDGRELPVEVTDTPVLDADGELVAIVGISRDVSDAWAARSALRTSEERLHLVRRAAPSVIWEHDSATGAVEWSQAMADTFGYTEEAVERTVAWWQERIHPDDRERVTASFRAYLDGDARFWTEEYRFRRADGSYAYVFDRGFATVEEGRGGRLIAGTMMDVTDRRRQRGERQLLTEAGALLDLSLDFHSTLPTLARLVVGTLADFCIIQLLESPDIAAFTTCAHADPARLPVLEELVEVLAPEPPPGPVTDRVLRDREPILLRDLRPVLRAQPSLHDHVRSAMLQLDPSSVLILPLQARNALLGYLVLGSAQSGTPFGESDMAVGKELARRIGAAVDHARACEAEQRARQAKSDFLSVMSHELRTPLTAVLGYADLLIDEVSGPLNPRQQKQVQRIRAGTNRLQRLMESILAYVRLETGNDRPTLASVPLPELIERVREVVEPRAREDGTTFRTESRRLPDRITTDPDRTHQILLALLTNALKFAPGGHVELRSTRDGAAVRFDVVDDGPGIPEDKQPHVFNAFWQAEQPTTRRAGGTGLGLSIARRTARRLGGDVFILDSGPAGTTFRFVHPLRNDA